MPVTTAAAVRAALRVKLQGLEGLDAIDEFTVEPDEIPGGGVFAAIETGADRPLQQLLGGTTSQYEMISEASILLMALKSDQDVLAARRVAITAALETDYTLGGAVDDVVLTGAENAADPEPGAETLISISIPLQLHYVAASAAG